MAMFGDVQNIAICHGRAGVYNSDSKMANSFFHQSCSKGIEIQVHHPFVINDVCNLFDCVFY